MSTGRAKPNEQLLEMLLLCLAWLDQESPSNHTGWTYNGIFQTLRSLGVVEEGQYRYVATGRDDTLNKYLMANGALAFPRSSRPLPRSSEGEPLRTALPSPRVYAPLVRESKRPLVIMVNRPLFCAADIVTPRGYPLLPTEHGRQLAGRVGAAHEPTLTQQGFMAQWRQYARQMRAMHAYGQASPRD